MEVTNGIPIPFTHMRKILALFLTLALLLAFPLYMLKRRITPI